MEEGKVVLIKPRASSLGKGVESNIVIPYCGCYWNLCSIWSDHDCFPLSQESIKHAVAFVIAIGISEISTEKGCKWILLRWKIHHMSHEIINHKVSSKHDWHLGERNRWKGSKGSYISCCEFEGLEIEVSKSILVKSVSCEICYSLRNDCPLSFWFSPPEGDHFSIHLIPRRCINLSILNRCLAGVSNAVLAWYVKIDYHLLLGIGWESHVLMADALSAGTVLEHPWKVRRNPVVFSIPYSLKLVIPWNTEVWCDERKEYGVCDHHEESEKKVPGVVVRVELKHF